MVTPQNFSLADSRSCLLTTKGRLYEASAAPGGHHNAEDSAVRLSSSFVSGGSRHVI